MENKPTPIDVLVDIDALFDTRLPVIYALSENIATTCVNDGSYFTRFKDNFGNISNDIFKSMYKYRDKRLLTLALPTYIFNMLDEYCIEAKHNAMSTDGQNKMCVYLNIYPYTLSTDEQDNLIEALKSTITGIYVKVVSMSNSELTPKWVDEHLSGIIKYDGLDWIEYHVANYNLINNPLLDVGLIVPAIVSGVIPSKDIDRTTFKDMMKYSGTLIGLTMINAKYFSLIK